MNCEPRISKLRVLYHRPADKVDRAKHRLGEASRLFGAPVSLVLAP